MVVRLIAIIALALSVIFDAWRISHGIWDYKLFALAGLLAWCVSDRWDPKLLPAGPARSRY